MTTFKQLKVGQEFDFVDDDSIFNDFFETCTKVSSDSFSWIDHLGGKHIEICPLDEPVFHVKDLT
jgi:hypothetical protein